MVKRLSAETGVRNSFREWINMTSGIIKCLSESDMSVIRLSSCFGKRYLRSKGQFHVNKCFRCNCQAVKRGSESDTWRLIALTSTMNYEGSVLTYREPKQYRRLCNTDSADTQITLLARKKREDKYNFPPGRPFYEWLPFHHVMWRSGRAES